MGLKAAQCWRQLALLASMGALPWSFCALVAVSTLPPGGPRQAVSAPGVCWGQQQNSPKLGRLNPRNPVSPWPEYLGDDTSHQGAEVPVQGCCQASPVCPAVTWSWPAAVGKEEGMRH